MGNKVMANSSGKNASEIERELGIKTASVVTQRSATSALRDSNNSLGLSLMSVLHGQGRAGISSVF